MPDSLVAESDCEEDAYTVSPTTTKSASWIFSGIGNGPAPTIAAGLALVMRSPGFTAGTTK